MRQHQITVKHQSTWIEYDLLKAQSHYDPGEAPVRDPGSNGMNRSSTGMNRGSTGDVRDEPGTTGAPTGKY